MKPSLLLFAFDRGEPVGSGRFDRRENAGQNAGHQSKKQANRQDPQADEQNFRAAVLPVARKLID
jgi:hypothetical protein